MFPVVRPSVRPSGSPSGFFRLRDNSSITRWNSSILVQGSTTRVDELIRFWARSAQRQGSKVMNLV